MQAAAPILVITSRFNRVLAVAFWTIAAVGIVVTAGTGRGTALVPVAAWLLIAGYYLLWRPRLEIGDDAVRVVNVVRHVRIPWAALVHVDTKYALSLHVPGRAWSVWCAPAPGPGGALRASRDERAQARGLRSSDRVRPGDLAGSESGRAAAAVRGRWEALRDAGAFPVGEAERTPVDVHVDVPAAVLLLGGLVAAVALSTIL